MFSTRSNSRWPAPPCCRMRRSYVQFYITARCNLTCKQCNIIYANSDVREATLDEIKRIADNFAQMGVAMVPADRRRALHPAGSARHHPRIRVTGPWHVRMQTNGLASDERIPRGRRRWWPRHLHLPRFPLARQPGRHQRTASPSPGTMRCTPWRPSPIPAQGGQFCLARLRHPARQPGDVEDVIRFGSEISWFSSVVPIHVTTFDSR